MGGEVARYWRHPGLPGTDLLRARYVTHSFARHTHNAYTIALVEAGIEEWRARGALERAGPGGMPLVNPGTVHTGHAGTPEGWTYRVMYPPPEVMAGVAAELGMGQGTPQIIAPVLDDPQIAALLLAAHRAAESGDALAASSLTRLLLARLLQRYGRVTTGRTASPPADAGAAVAARARDILDGRLADPPGLEALAAAVGTGPFPLLRAFRRAYALPPHAYLTQRRVERARELLDAGHPPATVAVAAGFYDQAHLTRHFRRILGVQPGAYQRERKNVQAVPAAAPLPSPA
jgi:AraC-like DNA-binding protein